MKQHLQKVTAIIIMMLMVVAATSTPVAAVILEEKTVGASLRIKRFVAATINESGNPGISFGSLIPGSKNNPEQGQYLRGALTVEMGVESNVLADVMTRAEDFTSGQQVLPIENVSVNTEDDTEDAIRMSVEFTILDQLMAGEELDIWHWLDVPVGQKSGRYTTIFYYQVSDVELED